MMVKAGGRLGDQRRGGPAVLYVLRRNRVHSFVCFMCLPRCTSFYIGRCLHHEQLKESHFCNLDSRSEPQQAHATVWSTSGMAEESPHAELAIYRRAFPLRDAL